MFNEDAIEVSALLNLTLTRRNGQPMCGIPYHSARGYIARLLKLGKRIAVCEQQSSAGKGIMERKVVEVISPGTVVEDDYLDSAKNCFLASLALAGKGLLSLSWVDLSTGQFRAMAVNFDSGAQALRRELFRIQPREILVQQSLLDCAEVSSALAERSDLVVNRFPDWSWDQKGAAARLQRQLGTKGLSGFGLKPESPEILSTGVLLDYLEDGSQSLLIHVRTIEVQTESDFVGIDESSQRNLELIQNLMDGSKRYSLLEVMDETRTGMGARLLRDRLLHPLRDVALITRRLEEVDGLYRDQGLLSRLREGLGNILDLERLAARIALDRANARDLVALRESLARAFEIDRALSEVGKTGMMPEAGAFSALSEAEALIRLRIRDEPSVLLTEGKMIREGVDADLDSLKTLHEDAHAVLADYLEEERIATGLSTLRLRKNGIIGYYLELSKAAASALPGHFVRKQSLVGAERFTTERLMELERRISGAEESIVEIEKRIFLETREGLKPVLPALADLARSIAALDVSQSLAFAATRRGWSCPRMDEGDGLFIMEGRHPVVEAWLPEGEFIPNDLELGTEGKRFALITGPNMAGKSTYLRQCALAVVMAQMGSFIPAREARLGLVDRIFCRVGAQDNLARGESTFLVEMNETAFILNTATPKSLVIMDEVGRGTSTVDGLSIAWAVAERLLDGIGARSLFATHYHELGALSHPALLPLCLEVLETEGRIVFMKRVKPGYARSSYGLHVARLAGLPQEVLDRAAVIQGELEAREAELSQPTTDGRAQAIRGRVKNPPAPSVQADLFSPEDLAVQELKAMDPDSMTPIEALSRLAALRKILSMK